MLFLIRMVVMVIDVLAIGYGDVFTYYVIKDGEGGGGVTQTLWLLRLIWLFVKVC